MGRVMPIVLPERVELGVAAIERDVARLVHAGFTQSQSCALMLKLFQLDQEATDRQALGDVP